MNPAEAVPDSLSRLRERVGVRARELRQSQTKPEQVLWNLLRNRQIQGLKFRRQYAIGPYFADFVCLEIMLVVELDGGQHVDAAAYDEKREAFMRNAGYGTLRFWNHEVLNETEAVLEKLLQVATLTPALSRKREREQVTSSCAEGRSKQVTPSCAEQVGKQVTSSCAERVGKQVTSSSHAGASEQEISGELP